MLRGLVFCAALVAVVGSTTYGSQQPSPADRQQAVPEQPAPQSDSPKKLSVAGVYLCEGANPDGSPYQGLVEIVAVDNTYLVRWTMADGAEVLGVGIRKSDEIGRASV